MEEIATEGIYTTGWVYAFFFSFCVFYLDVFHSPTREREFYLKLGQNYVVKYVYIIGILCTISSDEM